MKPKLLSYLLTSLIILPLPSTPTLSQTNPNPSHLAQTETFTPATINGKLDSNSQTREDKSYYNTHTFEGKEGEQITIELTSSEFTPRLYLFDSEKKQIAGNYQKSIPVSQIASTTWQFYTKIKGSIPKPNPSIAKP